jgi:hypothetical protein
LSILIASSVVPIGFAVKKIKNLHDDGAADEQQFNSSSYASGLSLQQQSTEKHLKSAEVGDEQNAAHEGGVQM